MFSKNTQTSNLIKIACKGKYCFKF